MLHRIRLPPHHHVNLLATPLCTVRVVHLLIHDILLNVFWEIPLAGGLMLQLSTAQAGPRKWQRKTSKYGEQVDEQRCLIDLIGRCDGKRMNTNDLRPPENDLQLRSDNHLSLFSLVLTQTERSSIWGKAHET